MTGEIDDLEYLEGDAMVRAWRFVNVAAYHEVSNPAWCIIFREMFIPSQYWDIVSMLCSRSHACGVKMAHK